MGYEKMSVGARTFLQEAARLAYGSGKNGGKSGGWGRMGLLEGTDGLRMIKFNTHYGERHRGSKTQGMIDSANNLRAKLIEIAQGAGITGQKMKDIRKALGLSTVKYGNKSDDLLNRTSVAKVVSLIGGDEVWNDILPSGVNMDQFVSDDDTTFARLEDRTVKWTNSAKDLGKWGRVSANELQKELAKVTEDTAGLWTKDSKIKECLGNAVAEAFSENFRLTLERSHCLDFVSISDIVHSMQEVVIPSLLGDGVPSAEEAARDPEAVKRYFAK